MAGLRAWFGRGVDQDYVDSINSFWTVLLLALCSVGSFTIRYIITPISCWCPAQFEQSQHSYTLESCFLKGLYYEKSTSEYDDEQQEPVPSYHLWIPLILLFQGLAFKLPNIIWNSTKHLLTFNMEETVESLKNVHLTDAETRQAMFGDAAQVFGSLLRRNRILLALLYLFVKLLSCVNLIAQSIFLTTYFRQYLAIRVGSYAGFDMDSIMKPLLVKDGYCDFEIHRLQTSQRYIVQCTLPITDVYEKMFTFLWYWVLLLSVITILNLVVWAGFLFLPFLRDGRIAAHLKAAKGSRPDEHSITRFISSFLGIDGVLVLSMISWNSSELVSAKLTQHLYRVFQEKEEELDAKRDLCTREPGTGAVIPAASGTNEALPMTELTSGDRDLEKVPIL